MRLPTQGQFQTVCCVLKGGCLFCLFIDCTTSIFIHTSVFVKGTKRIIFDSEECVVCQMKVSCVPDLALGPRFEEPQLRSESLFFLIIYFFNLRHRYWYKVSESSVFCTTPWEGRILMNAFRRRKKIFSKPGAPHQRGISYPLGIRELYFDISLFSLCWQLTWATSIYDSHPLVSLAMLSGYFHPDNTMKSCLISSGDPQCSVAACLGVWLILGCLQSSSYPLT